MAQNQKGGLRRIRDRRGVEKSKFCGRQRARIRITSEVGEEPQTGDPGCCLPEGSGRENSGENGSAPGVAKTKWVWEEWWLRKFRSGHSNVDGKFRGGRRRFSREWPTRGCFNWEARRAIGERGTEKGGDFVGGGRLIFRQE